MTHLIRFLTSLFAPSAAAKSSPRDGARAAAAQSVLVAASKAPTRRRIDAK